MNTLAISACNTVLFVFWLDKLYHIARRYFEKERKEPYEFFQTVAVQICLVYVCS